MKTNLALLTLAMVFGTLGVAGGQNFPPPYGCDPYLCDTTQSCVVQSGTCGSRSNPYNHFSVKAGIIGFCMEMDANGCTYSDLAYCSTLSYYNVVYPATTCTQANFQCTNPTYTSGCNP